MIPITITKRRGDFHACIENRPEIWGCGVTTSEAIGDLVKAHPEKFSVVVTEKPETVVVKSYKDLEHLLSIEPPEYEKLTPHATLLERALRSLEKREAVYLVEYTSSLYRFSTNESALGLGGRGVVGGSMLSENWYTPSNVNFWQKVISLAIYYDGQEGEVTEKPETATS